MTVVDIHCHVFNADDLPVRGFLQHLHLDSPVLGPMLSVLLDRVVQGRAPGYADEMPRIQRLLAAGNGAGPEVHGLVGDLLQAQGPSLEARTDAAFAELAAEDPAFLYRLGAAASTATTTAGAEAISAEGIGDRLADARRMVRWASLFGMSRLDVARELDANFDGEVDLYCPLLVDLGPGLGDRPKTTMAQQVEMLEGISVLSMRHQLPGVARARMHPFVGFDPRNQLRAEQAGLSRTPFDVVREAVCRRGFVGVKLYPPMGWRPLGNAATVDTTAAEAQHLDEVLRTFFAWCEEDEVPITAHANRSNYADDAFADFAGPDAWVPALEAFPGLRLNLGHFGGAAAELGPGSWAAKMVELARTYAHVYVDTGNHKVHQPGFATDYLDAVAALLGPADADGVLRRIMFGSDWYMLAVYPDVERFLTTYRAAFEHRFGADATGDFLGGNALRFLGLGDPASQNAARLHDFYARHAPAASPPWLARAGADDPTEVPV